MARAEARTLTPTIRESLEDYAQDNKSCRDLKCPFAAKCATNCTTEADLSNEGADGWEEREKPEAFRSDVEGLVHD